MFHCYWYCNCVYMTKEKNASSTEFTSWIIVSTLGIFDVWLILIKVISPYLFYQVHCYNCCKLLKKKKKKKKSGRTQVGQLRSTTVDRQLATKGNDLDRWQRPRHSRRIETEVGRTIDARLAVAQPAIGQARLSVDSRHSVIIVAGRSRVFEPATWTNHSSRCRKITQECKEDKEPRFTNPRKSLLNATKSRRRCSLDH